MTKRKKRAPPTKYKSRLEKLIADKLGPDYPYESQTIKFVQPAKKRTYKPDFEISPVKFIEVKGRLKPEDRMKHLWIKEQHPEVEVYFIFGRPQNRLYKNSSTTYAQWAEENGFEWVSASDPIPNHWLKGK